LFQCGNLATNTTYQSDDGNYFINLKFTDKANNPLPVNVSWNITVDSQPPRIPDIIVSNGVNISVDPEGLTFVNESPTPVFEVSYDEDKTIAPILVLAATGAYSVKGDWTDLVLTFLFMLVGFGMSKFKFSPVPLLLAFILGRLAENYLIKTLTIFGFGFFFLYIDQRV
jgi:hypothetical protein